MQLVAYGAQDIYLTGNPQITFFKVVYRRHTNFSMESIQQTLNGSSGFGGRCTATISRNGDLISRMYVEHIVGAVPNLAVGGGVTIANNYGHALLREVELEIGGQKIDKHFGRLMQTYSDLTQKHNGENSCPDASANLTVPTVGCGQLVGATLFQRMTGTGGGLTDVRTNVGGGGVPFANRYTIPLQFWFCRNPGLALPLIALQYHEVKVTIQLENVNRLIRDTVPTTYTSDNNLWVDYIYLDTDERRRFAQQSHEYLIEQVQHQSMSQAAGAAMGGRHELNFNHPVKELIWQFGLTTEEADLDADAILGATGSGHASTLATAIPCREGDAKLILNGHDRFEARDYRYFSRTQVLQHHTGSGATDYVTGETASNGIATGAAAMGLVDSIFVYSFALKPEEHQPSGTCNFSRIDNAALDFTTPFTGRGVTGDPGRAVAGGQIDTLHVYAINYNVLRIMSGMGGLAYSN